MKCSHKTHTDTKVNDVIKSINRGKNDHWLNQLKRIHALKESLCSISILHQFVSAYGFTGSWTHDRGTSLQSKTSQFQKFHPFTKNGAFECSKTCTMRRGRGKKKVFLRNWSEKVLKNEPGGNQLFMNEYKLLPTRFLVRIEKGSGIKLLFYYYFSFVPHL